MMKRAYFAGVLLVLLLAPCGRAAAAPSPIDAVLSLPYESILPGVPFDMTVTLRNVSSAPAAVGLATRLIVTFANGTKFTTPKFDLLEPRPWPSDQSWIELAPGESRDFFIDWHTYTPNLSHNPEFSRPGVYNLALELSAPKPPSDYIGTVVTTAARLTRAVTPGEDETLWRRMEAATDGRWADDSLAMSNAGPALLREILQIHPASAYYPYALVLEAHLRPLRQASSHDIGVVLEAATRFRSSPAHSHLLLRAGTVASSIALRAARQKDTTTFFDYFGRAEKYYQEAAKESNAAAVRVMAERGAMIAHDEMDHQRQRAAGTYGKVNQ